MCNHFKIYLLFLGDVLVNARYRLTNDNGLELSLLASTTKPTPINLANHSYFNLGKCFSLKYINVSDLDNGYFDQRLINIILAINLTQRHMPTIFISCSSLFVYRSRSSEWK